MNGYNKSAVSKTAVKRLSMIQNTKEFREQVILLSNKKGVL